MDLNATGLADAAPWDVVEGLGREALRAADELDAADALWDVLAALAGRSPGERPGPEVLVACRARSTASSPTSRSAADEPRLGELLLVAGRSCGWTARMSTWSRPWARNTCPYAAEPWTPTPAGCRPWAEDHPVPLRRTAGRREGADARIPSSDDRRTHDRAHPRRHDGAAGPGRPQRRRRGGGLVRRQPFVLGYVETIAAWLPDGISWAESVEWWQERVAALEGSRPASPCR